MNVRRTVHMDLDKSRLSKGVAALEALRDEPLLPDYQNSKLPKRRVDIITMMQSIRGGSILYGR
jgi:hypothetical protein